METTRCNVITDSSATTAEPADLSGEDEALDLRQHYTSLAHFFAAFEPASVRERTRSIRPSDDGHDAQDTP